jgi:hypothetical protein
MDEAPGVADRELIFKRTARLLNRARPACEESYPTVYKRDFFAAITRASRTRPQDGNSGLAVREAGGASAVNSSVDFTAAGAEGSKSCRLNEVYGSRSDQPRPACFDIIGSNAHPEPDFDSRAKRQKGTKNQRYKPCEVSDLLKWAFGQSALTSC